MGFQVFILEWIKWLDAASPQPSWWFCSYVSQGASVSSDPVGGSTLPVSDGFETAIA